MREEAEGEIRMIGALEELDLRDDGIDSPAEGAGTTLLLPGLALGWPGRLRLRSRNSSALLRTCEKSYCVGSQIRSAGPVLIVELTVGLIPRSTVLRSPVLRSPL